MRRVYVLELVALDSDSATFGNGGVVRVSIPVSVWKDDARPVTVKVTVEDM